MNAQTAMSRLRQRRNSMTTHLLLFGAVLVLAAATQLAQLHGATPLAKTVALEPAKSHVPVAAQKLSRTGEIHL